MISNCRSIRGGTCPTCCLGPQQRRLFSNTSFYDALPLQVDLLIDDLFDQLDLYKRALTRQLEQSSFFRLQRPQFRQQTLLKQQTGSGVKSKNVGQKTTCQNKFQGRPQQLQQQQLQKQKTTTKVPQQQLQQKQQKQQPLLSNINVPVKCKSMQQKYRICVDCRCCDLDPCKVQKSLKCGANGLYHLIVFAPCKSNPSKLFKRSYTLPSQVQHTRLSQSVTPQGHCLFEFPLMEEVAPLAIAELMPPVQSIKTPDGKKAFFAQVPILPIMDPAKVKVCVKDDALIVKFEHKKTIGDICSRVFFCCEVPLPKCNIDFSSIVCKQNKHTLNITVPVKQGTATKACINKEIPVHRKLRHGTMSSTTASMTTTQQQKQTVSSSGIQKQKQQLIQPVQKSKLGTSNKPNIQEEATTTKKQQKKQQQLPQSKGKSNVSYPKLGEGVSKGSELLEEVFGFGGGKSSQKQSSTVKQTKSSLEKGRVSSSDVKAMQQQGESGGKKSPQRGISPDKPVIQ